MASCSDCCSCCDWGPVHPGEQQQRRGVGRQMPAAARDGTRSGARSSRRRAVPRGPACGSRQREERRSGTCPNPAPAAAGVRKRPGTRAAPCTPGPGDRHPGARGARGGRP